MCRGDFFAQKFFYFFVYICNIYTPVQGMKEAGKAGRQARQANGRGWVDEAGNRGGRGRVCIYNTLCTSWICIPWVVKVG